MFRRTAMVSLAIASALLAPPAFGAEPAPAQPSAEQVKQLQQELAAMKKEMDALREEMKRQNAPAQGPMMGHMGQMQHHWQMMHEQSCGMNPAGCPGYRAPKK